MKCDRKLGKLSSRCARRESQGFERMHERPEWVTCVEHDHNDRKGYSWCGQFVINEFRFVSADHALNNALKSGRLMTCPECAMAMQKVLLDHVWDGKEGL